MKGSTRTKTVTKASSDASKSSKKKKEESSNALDDDDDDSSDDSDYDPNADGDDDDDDHIEGGEEDAIVPEISVGRLKKADEAWRDMVDEDVRSVSEIMAKAVNHEQKYGSSSSRSRKGGLKDESAAAARRAKSAIRKESIIAQIFGKKVARKMIHGVQVRRHSAAGSIDGGNNSSNSSNSNGKSNNNDDDGVRDRIKESVKKIMKKTKVVETKKFAGKEIQVERVVYEEVDSSNPADIANKSSKQGFGGGNSSNKSSSGGGIDSVLDTIKGPKAISTVTKSSMDWELYKDKEGLEDELAKASKEGYLTRKDFLERCDYRSFEMEREVRLKEQAARGSANL